MPPAASPECAAPAPAGLRQAVADDDGFPMPEALRRSAELHFDHPFDRVRLHTGPEPSRWARSVGARAFTLGEDIVFRGGQFLPDTGPGRALLWHELGHVASPPPGEARVLRAPLYDTTSWTLAPLPRGHTAKSTRQLLDDKIAKQPPDITSATVKGAAAGSEAEIFLQYILWQLSNRDRWDTVANLTAEIGWEQQVSKTAQGSSGIIPTGLVTVTIDAAGNATAELVSPMNTAVSPTVTVADAVAKLQGDYGFAAVEAGDKAWEAPDLGDVVGALALLPAGDRAALKGVRLQRFKTLGRIKGEAGEFSEGGGVAQGATQATPPTLKLADNAFTSNRFVSGSGNPEPASYQTILHEVGHAVEVAVERSALEQSGAAVIAQNTAVGPLNAAVAKVKAAKPGSPEAAALSATAKQLRKPYDAAVQQVAKASKALAATRVADTLVAPLAAAATAKKTAFDGALAAATTAANAYAEPERGASDAYRAAVAAAGPVVDDYVKRSAAGGDLQPLDDGLTAAVAARDAAREALKKAAAANPALTDFAAADQALDDWVDAARTLANTRGRSLRLQKFVDLVNANKIVPVTKYARDNWPYKPQEFYAEAYSLWLTEPAFLKKNYGPIFDFFANGDYLK